MNTTMYHVTPVQNLDAILREGIKPQIGERSLELGESNPVVYLFATVTDMEDAQWLYECFEEDEELVVLEVYIDGMDVCPTFEIPSWGWTCSEVIGADRIKVLHTM